VAVGEFLTDTHVLLLNISNATLRCGEQRTDIRIPRCLMCTHEISCNCVLRTWNKDGEVEIVFLPKMANCEKHNEETITRNLVNLAVLQHFFNDSQLGRLEGGTLLEKNLSITLPKFRTCDHKFKELLAADDTDRYNLEKFTKRVKNDSVIYHHLADVITDEMQRINFEDGYLNLNVENPNFWLRWATFIMSTVALALTLYLCFRMHVLASAIAISKSGAAQMATIPDKLIYVGPTTRTPLENETNWATVQFEWPNLDKWHYAVAITMLVILALIFLIGCAYKYRKFKNNFMYVVMEIGNNTMTVWIRCMCLPSAFHAYIFSAAKQLQFVGVKIFPPRFNLRWNDFLVKQILLQKEFHLPNLVKISVWNSINIRRILRDSYYTILFLEQGGIYKLVPFDTIQLEESTDNLAVSVNSEPNQLPVTQQMQLKKIYPQLVDV